MLGFNPVRQPLESNIAMRIEQSYDIIYAKLKSEGLAIWASTGQVPSEVADNVSALVAYDSISLGTSKERTSVIAAKYSDAMPMIRKFVAPHYQSQRDADYL